MYLQTFTIRRLEVLAKLPFLWLKKLFSTLYCNYHKAQIYICVYMWRRPEVKIVCLPYFSPLYFHVEIGSLSESGVYHFSQTRWPLSPQGSPIFTPVLRSKIQIAFSVVQVNAGNLDSAPHACTAGIPSTDMFSNLFYFCIVKTQTK